MAHIYSYVIKYDAGSAPNPFGGRCTLNICKPSIRKSANVGDWIIATGSKNSEIQQGVCKDFSNHLVYAMKVSSKITMMDYDALCKSELVTKIPNWKTSDWKNKVGDSIYDYELDGEPKIRRGVHVEVNRITDLSGLFTLLSDSFYYFGSKAVELPSELNGIIKKGPGHKILHDQEVLLAFESWISGYKLNKLYGEPTLKWHFDRQSDDEIVSNCSRANLEEALNNSDV